jgi:uncharacterized membrane protein
MHLTLMKRPSAILPFLMSLTAMSIVLGYIAIYGLLRQADEGAAAHTFQLLMIMQVPIMIYFAIRWIPQEPKPALFVLGLQVLAWLGPLGALYYLEH